MRILFLTSRYIIDPLGIAYLSAIAKRDGHTVDLRLGEDFDDINFNAFEFILNF